MTDSSQKTRGHENGLAPQADNGLREKACSSMKMTRSWYGLRLRWRLTLARLVLAAARRSLGRFLLLAHDDDRREAEGLKVQAERSRRVLRSVVSPVISLTLSLRSQWHIVRTSGPSILRMQTSQMTYRRSLIPLVCRSTRLSAKRQRDQLIQRRSQKYLLSRPPKGPGSPQRGRARIHIGRAAARRRRYSGHHLERQSTLSRGATRGSL